MGCSGSIPRNDPFLHNSLPVNEDQAKFIAECMERNLNIKNYLKSKKLKHSDVLKVAEAFKSVNFVADDLICSMKQQSTLLMILSSGDVLEAPTSKKMQSYRGRIFNAGSIIGETAFLSGAEREYSYFAERDCLIFFISNDIFQEAIFNVKNRSSITDIPFFSEIPSEEKIRLNRATARVKYQNNSVIFKEGDIATKFYVIAEGEVKILLPETPSESPEAHHRKSSIEKHHHDLILERDDFFGEESIILNEKQSVTAIAHGDVQLFEINKSDFFTVFPTVYHKLEEKVHREERKRQARKASLDEHNRASAEPTGSSLVSSWLPSLF